MQEVYTVLLAHWLKGRQNQQLECMGQSELQFTVQKLSFSYTYTYVTTVTHTHGLYALPAKEFFTASCTNISLDTTGRISYTVSSLQKSINFGSCTVYCIIHRMYLQ